MKRTLLLLPLLLLLLLFGCKAQPIALSESLLAEPEEEQVLPRPLPLSVLDADGSPVEAISLTRGQAARFTLVSEPGAVFQAVNPDASSCFAGVEGDVLTVTADRAQASSLLLRASLDGFADAEQALPITVTAIPAALSVPQKSLSGPVGSTLSLSCGIDPEGTLSVACDAALTATVSGGAVSFTSAQAGRYHAVLSVDAPGDLTAQETIEVIFEKPLVSLTVPGSVTLSAGDSTTVTISATPGASVWIETGGILSASITSDGQLTIRADQKGSGSVTVGASKEGYRDTSASIPVTVGVRLPDADSRYQSEARQIAQLVNAERAAHGLGALTYRESLEGLALLRAREASENWSHTRPDGRAFNTVFSDYDLHYIGTGENLFAANTFDLDLAMDEWMNSPDHRANILYDGIDGIAVGIIQGSDGDYYYCQLFVTD